MESKAAVRQSRTSVVDQSTFRAIVRICALADVIGIIAVVVLYNYSQSLRVSLAYSIALIALLTIGLIYNLFFWRRVNRKRPLVAIQFAILPLTLSIIIATFFTGGLNSPWYPMWYVAILCSGMTGTLSVTHTAGLTFILYLLSFHLSQRSDVVTMGTPIQALSTVIAIIAAYIIGRGMDRMVKTMQVAESLTKQLDGSELKQQLMLGAIADSVVAVDRDRKVVIFNNAAQKVTGWDDTSAKGIYYNLIFKLHDQNDAELTPQTDPFMQVMAASQSLTTDSYYMLDKNNRKIAFSIAIAPTLDAHGEVNGAIGIFHDISDQKALARERNEFISTASHEMRTPVAAIEGYLSMAMNPQLATIDPRAKSFVDKAHEASLHLGKLFRDLLSVTKIEDHRLTIKVAQFNLTDLLHNVINEMDIIARNKTITIESPFAATAEGAAKVLVPAYYVKADPDRIREVLNNLIDNAIKYSQPSGKVQVVITADQHFAQVRISDSGIGISPEDQKHLFQKFYRVNNSFTREVGGTGLGLYIARNLIELFGGKIWLESEEGKGSSFYFTLPIDLTPHQ